MSDLQSSALPAELSKGARHEVAGDLTFSGNGATPHWVHGVFQARILEWVTIFFSRDFPSQGTEPASPVSPALKADSLPAEPSEELT